MSSIRSLAIQNYTLISEIRVRRILLCLLKCIISLCATSAAIIYIVWIYLYSSYSFKSKNIIIFFNLWHNTSVHSFKASSMQFLFCRCETVMCEQISCKITWTWAQKTNSPLSFSYFHKSHSEQKCQDTKSQEKVCQRRKVSMFICISKTHFAQENSILYPCKRILTLKHSLIC